MRYDFIDIRKVKYHIRSVPMIVSCWRMEPTI